MTVKRQTELLEQELRRANIDYEVNYGLLENICTFLDIFLKTTTHPIHVRVEAFKKRGCDRIRIAIHCGEEFRDTRYRRHDLARNARKAVARIKKILEGQDGEKP